MADLIGNVLEGIAWRQNMFNPSSSFYIMPFYFFICEFDETLEAMKKAHVNQMHWARRNNDSLQKFYGGSWTFGGLIDDEGQSDYKSATLHREFNQRNEIISQIGGFLEELKQKVAFTNEKIVEVLEGANLTPNERTYFGSVVYFKNFDYLRLSITKEDILEWLQIDCTNAFDILNAAAEEANSVCTGEEKTVNDYTALQLIVKEVGNVPDGVKLLRTGRYLVAKCDATWVSGCPEKNKFSSKKPKKLENQNLRNANIFLFNDALLICEAKRNAKEKFEMLSFIGFNATHSVHVSNIDMEDISLDLPDPFIGPPAIMGFLETRVSEVVKKEKRSLVLVAISHTLERGRSTDAGCLSDDRDYIVLPYKSSAQKKFINEIVEREDIQFSPKIDTNRRRDNVKIFEAVAVRSIVDDKPTIAPERKEVYEQLREENRHAKYYSKQ